MELKTKETIFVSVGFLIGITSIGLAVVGILSSYTPVDFFQGACESYGGYFYQLQNTSCAVGHMYCINICNLNGERFSMDDIDTPYPKSICIKDCVYENEKAGEIVCVC